MNDEIVILSRRARSAAQRRRRISVHAGAVARPRQDERGPHRDRSKASDPRQRSFAARLRRAAQDDGRICDDRGLAAQLRSRVGEGYLVLMAALLPLLLMLTAFVFDGLAMVVAYRRAQGLATLGIQAVAGAPSFDGNRVRLPSAACTIAASAVCGATDGACLTGHVRMTCTQTGEVITIRVGVKPKLLGSGFGLRIDYASAEARGGPRFGVNHGE